MLLLDKIGIPFKTIVTKQRCASGKIDHPEICHESGHLHPLIKKLRIYDTVNTVCNSLLKTQSYLDASRQVIMQLE